MISIDAYIFDLDGVIVDTAKYHYMAWKRLAEEFGYEFTEEDNKKFKGVSRKECMNILSGLLGRTFSEEEKIRFTDKKNEWYREYIRNIQKDEILPGFLMFITEIRRSGRRTALASASKNAGLILDTLELRAYFDEVIDGNLLQRSKPDPQVFLLAAEKLGVVSSRCLVFEDAQAGIEAAKRAQMLVVGISSSQKELKGADLIKPGFEGLDLHQILNELEAAVL